MRESIFSSAIRAFFVALCALIGIMVGLILLVVGLAAIPSSTPTEVERSFTAEILPNAKGVRKHLGKDAPVLLQINIEGFIGSDKLSQGTIRKMLVESREGDLASDRVKGIMLYINSPGGGATDADGIYHAIKTYKEQYKVPVYAFVDGMCASGAMYIACAADKIYSTDTSIIGSIGVVTPPFMNVTQLLDKIGVQSLTLSAGKGKDELNPFRTWKPGESDVLQAIVGYYYDVFVNIVAANRGIEKQKIVSELGAGIFNPIQSTEYGLINAHGYQLNKALEELVAKADIKEDNYQYIQLEQKTWYSDLFKTQFSLLSGKIVHQVQLYPDIDPQLMNQFLYLYRP